MTTDEIEAQVREFLVSNFLFDPSAALAAEDSLLENGVVDSTGMLEVIQFLEATFDIQVDDMEVLPENLDSVRNLIRFIVRKRAAEAADAA
ncbi:MAG TPA: acyl carrier protein [Chloroflexia bacterium]